jgi:hypothetical protein
MNFHRSARANEIRSTLAVIRLGIASSGVMAAGARLKLQVVRGPGIENAARTPMPLQQAFPA